MLQHIRAYFRLRVAQFYFQKKNPSKGLQILEKITEFAPTYHFAYFHLGWKWAELEQFDKAATYLQKAIEYNPKSSVYHTFLGMVWYDQGLYAKAKGSLEQALHLDPANQLSSNYLALCHLGEGDFHSCAKILQEKGVFENAAIHTRLMLGLARYHYGLNHPKAPSSEPSTS